MGVCVPAGPCASRVELDLHICSTVSLTDAGGTCGRSIAVHVYSPESNVSVSVIVSRPSCSIA